MNFDPLDPGFDFLGIFSVFFVGLAVFLGLYGFRALILGRWSLRWPTASGRITDAWTEWRSGSRGARYRVRLVRYAYEASGQVLEGNAIRPTDWYEAGANFVYLVERYPRGAHVTVSYDPNAPAKAFLEPGIPRATWWCFFLSALFLGIANLFYRVHR